MANTPKIFPIFKKEFPYKQSRLGLLPFKPVKGINKLLNNSQETIFHHQVKCYTADDYSNVIISIIKMGGNVSMRDTSSAKPLDPIKRSQEKLKSVLDNLNTTLARYKKDSNIIGLRLQRAKIELLDGKERENATTKYLLRLKKCMTKLLNGTTKEFTNNLDLFNQFLFEEYDENLKNDAHMAIVNFLKDDTSSNFDDKLNAFIHKANIINSPTLKIALLDVGYTKASSLEEQVSFLKKMALNYYPNDTIKQQIIDRYNYLKQHVTDENMEQFNDLEKTLKRKKLYKVKEYMETIPINNPNTSQPRKKGNKKAKSKINSNESKQKNIQETTNTPKNETSTVTWEVLATEQFNNKRKKLAHEKQTGIDIAINALKTGDTSGLNVHGLSGKNEHGKFAIDVKDGRKGRGAARLTFTKDEQNNTVTIKDFIPNHNYNKH